MKNEDVLQAQFEARRFLDCLHDLIRAAKVRDRGVEDICPMIQRAAVKRASMDLTRALARLRR